MEVHICNSCTGEACDDADLKVRAGNTIDCSGYVEDNGDPIGPDSCESCENMAGDSTSVPQGDQMVSFDCGECTKSHDAPPEGKRCEDWGRRYTREDYLADKADAAYDGRQ